MPRCLLLLLLLALSPVAAATLGDYARHQTTASPAAVVVTTGAGETLRLRAYGDQMVRVQAARPGEKLFPDDLYRMIERHDHGGSLRIVSDSAEKLVLTTGPVVVTVSKKPLRLAFADASGRPLLADAEGIRLDPKAIVYDFTPDPAEKLLGFGQERLSLQETFTLEGRVVKNNYSDKGFPGRGSQGVLIVPFHMSQKGYGLFANSMFPHEGNFGANGTYRLRFDTAGHPAQADYVFILGPKPADILDRYTLLTGRPRLPQKSIFGLHLSDNEPWSHEFPVVDYTWWQNQVAKHHAAGFPLDHLVYDNDWRAASPLPGGKVGQWGGSQFAFDAKRYPDPAAFRRWYDAAGLTLTLDLNMNNANDSVGWRPEFNLPVAPKALANAASNYSDSYPDYSNPATREWIWRMFWDKAFDPALKYPGDAIWLDESDAIWWGTVPPEARIANGRPWFEMQNYYFFLTADAVVGEGWDNAERGQTPGIGEAKRPHVWIRGGSSGMQRYATHWTGDIDYTAAFYHGHIIGLQASGLAGFPFFNHDAGGFGSNKKNPDPLAHADGPTNDYYIQWGCAFGSFTPYWRIHGYGKPRWPANRDQASQDAFRRYATLRYELMPYIYTLAHEAHATGLPMARPLPVAFPDAPEAWNPNNHYSYLWGDAFLVAPGLQIDGTDAEQTTWLPPAPGGWYDYWTGALLPADTRHTFTSRFGVLPLFVKAGSIIPRQNYALSTRFLSDKHLTLDVYTGADGRFLLREDDGVTERFRTRGELRTTPIGYRHADRAFALAPAQGTYEGASPTRTYHLRFHGLAEIPAALRLDGGKLGLAPAAPSAHAAVTEPTAWWDASARLLHVRLPSRPVGKRIDLTHASSPSQPLVSSNHTPNHFRSHR
jgi:alpha-D-xyloside xylohydrolase